MERLGFLLGLLSIFAVGATSSLVTRFEQSKPMLSAPGKILACYYRNNIINDDLVPHNVCTHIIFAFGKVTPNGIASLNDTRDPVSYRTLIKLKQKNPQLKIMISLQPGFSSVVSFGTEDMLRFSLAAVDFLNKYGFDGVDFDWEFPTVLEKNAYAEFIMIASRVLHWSNKTLSLALPHDLPNFEKGFYPDTINEYVDFVTVMTYDYYSCTYKKRNITDYNAPLYPSPGDDPFDSVSTSLEYLMYRGVSPSKMLLGYPTYGRSYKLANPSVVGPHVPAAGCTDKPFYLLQEICQIVKHGGKAVKDTKAGAEYMTYNDTWVSFNGMYSAAIESDWMKANHLAGIGVWTLEDDDPMNVCGMGRFPILTKLCSYL